MAHTDPFIFLPIVVWVFISFWFVYLLVTTYFFPLIYKSYRTRLLASTYFNKDFYNQIWSVLGFYVIFEKTTSNFYSLVIKFFRSAKLILKLKVGYSFLKVNLLAKRLNKFLSTV